MVHIHQPAQSAPIPGKFSIVAKLTWGRDCWEGPFAPSNPDIECMGPSHLSSPRTVHTVRVRGFCTVLYSPDSQKVILSYLTLPFHSYYRTLYLSLLLLCCFLLPTGPSFCVAVIFILSYRLYCLALSCLTSTIPRLVLSFLLDWIGLDWIGRDLQYRYSQLHRAD